MSEIQDSGTRREFETGAVRDMPDGKGRFDLMPLDVVADIVAITDTNFIEIINCEHAFLTFMKLGLVDGNYWSFVNACETFIKLRGWSAPEAMLEVAIHFEDGARKYGENNWQKGIPISSYVDSAYRHYFKWKCGLNDERHDRAVLWNLMCAAWTVVHRPDTPQNSSVS